MKKNNYIQNGSLVLIVLITMTAFVVIVHSILRASCYFTLLARERETCGQMGKKA